MYAPGARGQGRRRGGDRGRGNDHPRGRGAGPRNQPGSDRPRGPGEPRHPLGLRKLQELEGKSPSEVVLFLKSETSGFREMLQERDLRREKLSAAWAVVALACRCEHKRNLAEFLKLVNDADNFAVRGLQMYLMMVQNGRCLPDDVRTMDSVTVFLENLNLLPPAATLSTLGLVLPILKDTVKSKLAAVGQGVLDRLERVEEQRTALRDRFTIDFENVAGARAPDEPTDDFREIPVIPEAADVIRNVRPFLRPNIVSGRYRDVDHYLDVQFRLLREDFVRPLREGIASYREQIGKGARPRLQEIKVFQGVEVKKSMLTEDGVRHVVQFPLEGPLQRVKWEYSKRLIFGSLLCFTDDDFESLMFATVADRNVDNLKAGLLAVRFEQKDVLEVDKDYTKKYVMIETDAYFEAYRHVLTVLQQTSADSFPLKEYIVSVEKQIAPPKYATNRDVEYTFGSQIRPVSRPDSSDSDESNDEREATFQTFRLPGNRLRIHDDSEWLKLRDGLDDSQREAVKSALTRSLSIIQGPPGTGKTYVGLRIVEILLANRDHWAPRGDPCPIVVVCFTNHALDQFLEGIMKYTQSIVRIGGRSKSEALTRFNLNELRKLVGAKMVRDYTLRARREVETKMRDTIKDITQAEKRIKQSCSEALKFEELLEEVSEEQTLSLTRDRPRYLPAGLDINTLFGYWLGVEVQEGAMVVPEVPADEAVAQPEPRPENEDSGEEEEIDMTQPYEEFEEEAVQPPEPRNAVIPPENVPEREVLPGRDAQEEVLNPEDLGNVVDVDYLMEQRMVADDFHNPIGLIDLNDGEDDDEVRVPGDADNDGWQRQGGRKQMKKVMYRRLKCNPMSRVEAEYHENLWALTPQDRWRLYRYWLDGWTEKQTARTQECKKEMEGQLALLSEIKQEREKIVVDDAHVVGLTTTGAAKYHHLIRGMKSKIVIVEEAAEVLEAHIVTALSVNTQHLILIGDHQQLRPNPTVYELGKKYNLEISLFERLLNNGLPFCKLRLQHRMKPCISALLSANIYPDLLDHESVRQYEDIKGMERSMFFLKHTAKEFQSNDSTSRVNTHEIDILVELCRYLLLQGYRPSRITILATYLAQFYMLKRNLAGTLKEVKVTVVDNYQGEENDIILLSLVRSNEEGAIGFLKIENRVCVALSRAKHGLYCVGNLDLLAGQSPLWRRLTRQLEEQGAIGTSMNVKCQNHGNLVPVDKAADFFQIQDGGCLEPCEHRLPCGHVCHRKCHPDDLDHARYVCKKQCEKILCERGHQCPKVCSQRCGDCDVPVEKVLPACGHKASIPCHKDPAMHLCRTPCPRTLDCGHGCRKICGATCGDCPVKVNVESPCGHLVNVACHNSADSNAVLKACVQGCQKLLDCGHRCTRFCSQECNLQCMVQVYHEMRCGHRRNFRCHQVCSDASSRWEMVSGERLLKRTGPGGAPLENNCGERCGKVLECGHLCGGTCGQCVQGRIHVSCRVRCGRVLTCGHECSYPCAASCPPCIRPCENRCVHSKCQLPCGYPCTPCMEPCAWKCKHLKCNRRCSEPCDRGPCNWACNRKLRCGHKCIGLCGEPCPTKCRVCHRGEVTNIFFGNEDNPRARFVQLEDCFHVFEVRGFTRWIEDQQARSSNIKPISCPLCTRPLRKNMRYNAAVKKTVALIEEVKKKVFGGMEKSAETARILLLQTTPSTFNVRTGSPGRACPSTDPSDLRTAVHNTLSDKRFSPDLATLARLQNYVKFVQENLKIVSGIGRVFLSLSSSSQDIKERALDFVGCTLCSINQKIGENRVRGSDQLVDDIHREFRRLNLIVKFLDGSKPALTSTKPELKTLVKEALDLLLCYAPFAESHHSKLREIQGEMKKLCEGMTVLGITEDEKLNIIKAMGLKQGHWYQCPNGHVYCIADCGGATVEGRCNECKAVIGGGNHTLRSDNRVATAMDGARHSAWSNQANMGNYVFDDI